MRYAMDNNCCIDYAPPWLAFDAGNASLNSTQEEAGEQNSTRMSDERFTALSELAEVLRDIHEELLAEGINLLEDDSSASRNTYDD